MTTLDSSLMRCVAPAKAARVTSASGCGCSRWCLSQPCPDGGARHLEQAVLLIGAEHRALGRDVEAQRPTSASHEACACPSKVNVERVSIGTRLWYRRSRV